MKIPQILQISTRFVVILTVFAGCGKNANNGNSGGNSNTGTNQTPILTVTSISPTHAPGSAKDTITGTGFDPNNSSVSINGQKATLISATGTQLIIGIPALSGSGKITVTTGNIYFTSSNGVGKITADSGSMTDRFNCGISSTV